MPIDVNRIASDRVILACFYGEITLEDIRQNVQTVEGYLDEAQEITHMIIQMEDVTHYPWNIKEIYQAMAVKSAHPRLGWLIACGMNKPMAFTVSVISQLTSTKIRTFATLEAGLAFLKQHDFTLS